MLCLYYRPTVPQGVADEVQKVLDLVHAESPQREEGTQSPLPVPSQRKSTGAP